MASKKSPKIPKIFECEICEYSTCNKKDYDKHLSTRKHKMLVNASTTSQNPQNDFLPKKF